MIKIPACVSARFNDLLLRKKISSFYQYHYRKWLRYYLDFCSKNLHNSAEKLSLPQFINKLLEHSDVRTTMVYTHMIKSMTLKEAKSPLDF
ncbi:MAG: hypothetical protein V3R54_08775 [Thermodesulfovibrionia bacterium]